MLCDGRIDACAINAALSVDEMFVAPDDEPSWRKVWHGIMRDALEFGSAFITMEKEFVERKFDDPGIVLHVMGLRLWGSEIGELEKGEDTVVREGKSYIDDLRRSGRLRLYRQQGFHDAAHGLQYHNAETDSFRTLRHYLSEQSQLAYEDGWSALGESLVEDMSGDGEKFYGRICWSGGHSKPDCADDAILLKISPKIFVDKLLTCSPQAQRTILGGLRARYEGGQLTSSLMKEGPWLISMNNDLHNRLPNLPRIRQYSLSQDFARLLGAALREVQAATGSLD